MGLFATRTSCQHLQANQLRVLLAALGYVLIERLRALALQGTELVTAQVDTLWVKLLKVAAIVTRNNRSYQLTTASGPHLDWKILSLHCAKPRNMSASRASGCSALSLNFKKGKIIMAFNIGFGTIAPGQAQRWWYSFGGGDHGAQYCMAHPLNPGGVLQVNDQSKARNNDGSITYWVTIRNIGGLTTNFNLQGGGLT